MKTHLWCKKANKQQVYSKFYFDLKFNNFNKLEPIIQ